MKPAEHSGGRVNRTTGPAMCWVCWPCIAPSIHSPENYFLSACFHPHPQTCVRSHGASSSVSLGAGGGRT